MQYDSLVLALAVAHHLLLLLVQNFLLIFALVVFKEVSFGLTAAWDLEVRLFILSHWVGRDWTFLLRLVSFLGPLGVSNHLQDIELVLCFKAWEVSA